LRKISIYFSKCNKNATFCLVKKKEKYDENTRPQNLSKIPLLSAIFLQCKRSKGIFFESSHITRILKKLNEKKEY